MNHGDCDAAVNDLKSQTYANPAIEGPWSYYSIRGSVIAFICWDYTGVTNFRADAVGLAASIATDTCGWYVPGTVKGMMISPWPAYGMLFTQNSMLNLDN